MTNGASPVRRRLFVGMRLPPEVRASLAKGATRLAAANATALRLILPENYHITLAFIGDPGPVRSEEIVAALEHALQPLLATTLPADAAIERWGAFPSWKRPRVAWAGVSDAGTIAGVAQAVAAALTPLSIALPTRGFTPHVTVGYVRRGLLREEPFGSPLPVSFPSVSLINSTPGPDGSTYEEVMTWDVAKP